MADRDAKVRLNLAAAGFLSSMQQLQKSSQEFGNAVEGIGGAAEKSSRKTSAFFSSMKAGIGGARTAVSELGGQLKSTLMMAATLGGAVSLGGAIHGAQAATSSYKDLAFAIRVGTGAATSWQDVQKDVEATSGRWKRSNKEVQESYAGLFSETGNQDFSKAAIDAAGQAADATGKSMQTWSDIAGTLNEKFGIGGANINDSLASVIELTNKGGATAEELASKLGLVGASAKLLGMTGEEGLKRVLAMTNMADDSAGTLKQKFGAVSNVLEQMADPERLKQIEKALGVKLTDSKGGARADAIERIIAKTKGDEGLLRKAFGSTEVKLVASMAKPFVDAFAAAKGTVQQRTAAALDAYGKALEQAGKTTYDGAALQKDATDRLSDAPRNIAVALNDFQKVFERPEMVRAVDQAAAAAPKLAGVLADIVGFATNHPLLAGGAVVGGVAAKGAAGAVITKVSESAMERAGDLLSANLAKPDKWTTMGKLAGASFVAAAAASGWMIGKAIADYLLDSDNQKQENLNDAASTAESMVKHGTGTPEQRKQAAAALRAQLDASEEGPGLYTQAMGGLSGEDATAAWRKSRDNALDQLRSLEGGDRKPDRPASFFDSPGGIDPAHPFGTPAFGPPAPPRGVGGGPSGASSKLAGEVANGERKVSISNHDAMAQAFARALAAQTLNVRGIGGGGSGSNGLPPAPGTDSGSTPK